MKRIICTIAAMLTALLSGCGNSGENTLTVTFFDVGKGDCILAECGGSTLMIDTGYASTAKYVLTRLSDMGITKLDRLIISHYDKDHVGGAAEIISSLPVDHVYLPDYEGSSEYYTAFSEAMTEKGTASEKVSENTSFELGSAVFTVYSSDIAFSEGKDGREGNDNDVSLVVSSSNGRASLLFAGDIEKEGIKSFLKKNTEKYDVIKMPHHGSKESNTDRLIGAVSPRIAVITDSKKDQADKKTLSLLEGTEVYRSSVCGEITIKCTENGKYRVETEKQS